MRVRYVAMLVGAYVAATAAHIAFVVSREPFSFDAWNVAADTGARPATLARFFAYWRFEYAHSNPRLGQPLTYLAYKLGGFAEVATPLAFLALTLAVTVLGLGRMPRRGRELAIWAVAIGLCWFALPQIGRNLFSRAYAANYVYTAAIQLWFLVPLRLTSRRGDAPTREQVATYAMAGALAGMCNEHTGPALVAALLAYAWWERRAGRSPAMPLAGAVGLLAGVLALLFAPGQGERYGGLAQRHTLVGQVLDRGVAGALQILGDYLAYAAPLLVLLVVLHVVGTRSDRIDDERRSRVLAVIAIAIGFAVVATLCASPKLGSRFFIVPMSLLLAAVIAALDVKAISARRLAPFLVLAVLASGYAAVQTVPLYRRLHAQGAARMAALEATPPGRAFVAEPFAQVEESWWCIGDDFRKPDKRAFVARYLGLAAVTLRSR